MEPRDSVTLTEPVPSRGFEFVQRSFRHYGAFKDRLSPLANSAGDPCRNVRVPERESWYGRDGQSASPFLGLETRP
jgi:hypothetical protein